MVNKVSFEELLKRKPLGYEITNDGKCLFDLQNGEKAELQCDFCEDPYWKIGVAEEKEKDKERITFRIICHNCFKGIYLLWIEPKKKE